MICPVCKQPLKKIEGEIPDKIAWFCTNCEIPFDTLGKAPTKVGSFAGVSVWDYGEDEEL